MRTLMVTTISAAVLSLSALGCSQPSATPEATDTAEQAVQLVNFSCPMQGVEVDETVTVDWNGKKVAFCCEKCAAAWENLSEDEKSTKLAAAMEPDDSSDDTATGDES